MADQFGLQPPEDVIPKLTDDVREKLEAADERLRVDPARCLIEDTLTRLTQLLEDWEAVFITPSWRSEASIAADRSERPGRLRVLQDLTVTVGEGARVIRQPVATEQLEVFMILDRVTKHPWMFASFTNVHKRGRPYFELARFAPERFEYFAPTFDNWGAPITFLQTQMKDHHHG